MKERDLKIDIFKALLVLGMVYCHSLQFFSNTQIYKSADVIISIINVITFSGFVFTFGYTSRIAYFSKNLKDVYTRIINTAFKTLIAFYISGIGFRVLVDKRPLELETILKVVTLSDIPGWSEFLISFTLYILIAAILFKPLKLLVEKKVVFWIVFAMLFLTTLIPYDKIQITQLGLVIGTAKFACFPIVQYMPFYLVGMYFQRYKITFNLKLFIGSLILTGIAIVDMIIHGGELPGRFPPTAMWLFLSMFIIYLYYLTAKMLTNLKGVLKVPQPMGNNTLIYLVLSNIIIFALKGSETVSELSPVQTLLFTAILLTAIAYFINITQKVAKASTP